MTNCRNFQCYRRLPTYSSTSTLAAEQNIKKKGKEGFNPGLHFGTLKDYWFLTVRRLDSLDSVTVRRPGPGHRDGPAPGPGCSWQSRCGGQAAKAQIHRDSHWHGDTVPQGPRTITVTRTLAKWLTSLYVQVQDQDQLEVNVWAQLTSGLDGINSHWHVMNYYLQLPVARAKHAEPQDPTSANWCCEISARYCESAIIETYGKYVKYVKYPGKYITKYQHSKILQNLSRNIFQNKCHQNHISHNIFCCFSQHNSPIPHVCHWFQVYHIFHNIFHVSTMFLKIY